MTQHNRPVPLVKQKGAAILLLMLIIFLGSTYWLLESGTSVSALSDLEKKTAQALFLAEQALIGRSAMDASRPGSLPCPDTNNDGVAELFSGNHCPSYVGRLPWKTLGTQQLRDGYGNTLWYALSPSLRDHPAAQPINPSRTLELNIDSLTNIAAIIFAPGPPLAGQNGRTSNAAADYLDASNADGDFTYSSGPRSESFNDQTLTISREEIFRTVNIRVLREIRGPDNNAPAAPSYGLRHFLSTTPNYPLADSNGDGYGDTTASGTLPYNDLAMNSATLFPPYAWMIPNDWLSAVSYRRLDATSARISIGSYQMDVSPCTSPCP